MLKQNDIYKAYLMLIMTSIGWAISTIVIKIFISKIGPYHLMFGRFAIAFLLVWLMFPKKFVKVNMKSFAIVNLIGLLTFLSYAFAINSLRYTTASKSGFLVALSVLLIPIAQFVFRRKIPQKTIGVTILLSIVGLRYISGMDGVGFNYGDLLALLCSVTYTGYILIVDNFVKKIDTVTLILYQLLTVTFISFIMSVVYEGIDVGILINNITPILITGVFGTAMTVYFQIRAQKYASPESVGLLLLGEPVFTLILAIIILGETVTLKGMMGASLIITAMVITIKKKL